MPVLLTPLYILGIRRELRDLSQNAIHLAASPGKTVQSLAAKAILLHRYTQKGHVSDFGQILEGSPPTHPPVLIAPGAPPDPLI